MYDTTLNINPEFQGFDNMKNNNLDFYNEYDKALKSAYKLEKSYEPVLQGMKHRENSIFMNYYDACYLRYEEYKRDSSLYIVGKEIRTLYDLPVLDKASLLAETILIYLNKIKKLNSDEKKVWLALHASLYMLQNDEENNINIDDILKNNTEDYEEWKRSLSITSIKLDPKKISVGPINFMKMIENIRPKNQKQKMW